MLKYSKSVRVLTVSRVWDYLTKEVNQKENVRKLPNFRQYRELLKYILKTHPEN